MPVYLTQEEIDGLDQLALDELQNSGGYLVKPKPSIANVASTAWKGISEAASTPPPLSPEDAYMAEQELAYNAPPPAWQMPTTAPYSPASQAQVQSGAMLPPPMPTTLPPSQGLGASMPPAVYNGGVGISPTVGGIQNQGLPSVPSGATLLGAGLRGLDLPRELGGVPYIGAAANMLQNPSPIDIASLGAGPLGPLTAPVGRLVTDYGGSKERGEGIRQAAYDINPAVGTAFDVASDPLSYLPVGAAGKAFGKAPVIGKALSGKYNPVGALIEGYGPTWALPNAALTGLGVAANENLGDIPGVPRGVQDFAAAGLGPIALGIATKGRSLGNTKMAAAGDEGIPSFPTRELPEQVRADLSAAQTKITDYARAEAALRRQGIPQAEIAAGRSRQAAGVMREVEQATAEGLDPRQVAQRAREGLATGRMRETITPAMEFTPGETHALFADINNQLRNGSLKSHEYWNRVHAIEAVITGEGLQPAQIKLVRRMFGDEVADALVDRPLSLRQTLDRRWRELTTAKSAEMRAASHGWPSMRTAGPGPSLMEEIAKLQDASPLEREIATKHLTKLQERIDKARARDEARAAKALQDANERDATLAIKQMRGEPDTVVRDRYGVPTDVNVGQNWRVREKWKAITADGDLAAQHRNDLLLDPVERDIAAKAYANAGMATPEEAITKVRDKIDAMHDPDMQSAANAVLQQWQRDAEEILSSMGDRGPSLIDRTLALATGDVADSYLAQVVRNTSNLENALEKAGFPRQFAREIADGMTQYEIARKYGRAVPEHIQQMLKSTAPTEGGVSNLVQELKNMQFGIADVAVVGQQVLKALITGGPMVMAGAVNRALQLIGVQNLAGFDSNVSRSVAYALDGVKQGTSTGMTDFEYGKSFLSRIPAVKTIDEPVMRVAERLNSVQFGWLLTGIRNLNYEGNLMVARAAGLDINNPAVRARAAAFANANTSLGALAQRAGRRQGEAALALSPSMRRAQVQQLLRVAQGVADLRNLKDPVKRTNAVLATMTLGSFGVTTMVLGKFLHDNFGAPGTDFEFDPSKPGWGYITLGNGRVISLFPQEQVLKTVARSMRAISEEDWDSLGKEWIKFGLSTQSPVMAVLSAAAGYGYDPETGYRLGDLGENQSFLETVLRLAPIPPSASTAIHEGVSPWLAAEAVGIPTFDEGPSGELARKYKVETGRDYWEDVDDSKSGFRETKKMVDDWIAGDPALQELKDQSLADAAKRGSEPAAAVIESTGLRDTRVSQQLTDDARLASREMDGEEWRGNRKIRMAASRAEQEVVFSRIKEQPERDAVDAYYKAIEKAQMPNGVDVDWTAVDRWMASQPELTQRYIDKWTGVGGTTTEKEYRAAVKRIEATGYWDQRDKAAVDLAPRLGFPAVQSADELESVARPMIEDKIRTMGYDPGSPEGGMLYTKLRDAYLGPYDTYVSKMLEVQRVQNPQLIRDLYTWGYYPGSLTAFGVIANAP